MAANEVVSRHPVASTRSVAVALASGYVTVLPPFFVLCTNKRRINVHCPPLAEPLLLRRFYQCMYGDLEETRKLIEVNYALRNRHPHLFIHRDPLDEDSRRTFDYA